MTPPGGGSIEETVPRRPMLCPRCNKNVATLQVTEVTEFKGHGDPGNKIEEHPLCEVCAQQLGLPAACPLPTQLCACVPHRDSVSVAQRQLSLRHRDNCFCCTDTNCGCFTYRCFYHIDIWQ